MFSSLMGSGRPPITETIDDHCERFSGDGRAGMDKFVLSWLTDSGYPGALEGNEDLEAVLKSGKCDVTTPAPHGGTALHAIAMAAGKAPGLAALQLVLDYHPELVNTRSRATETALHMVAMYGNVEAARELLRRGADPTLKTYKGQDCAELATSGPMKSHRDPAEQSALQELFEQASRDFKSKCHLPGCDQPGQSACGRSRRARYCGQEHQTEHWKATPAPHKKLCRTYQALQAEPEVPECRNM